MAQSFGAWLKAQQDRNDLVGDLASDFITACKWRDEDPELMTTDHVRFQMGCLSASLDAYRALAKASKEWQRSR
jgi:hypothetical protein